MKKFNLFVSVLLSVLACVCGGGAVMAIGGGSPAEQGAAGANGNGGTEGQGATNPAANHENLDGTASQTENGRMNPGGGQGTGSQDFDKRPLSSKILELQPMKTPFDQLTRHASVGEKPEGMKVEYASIGSRPTETKVKAGHAFSIASGNMSGTLYVDDPQIFSVDDVILVQSVKAVTRYDGTAYASVFNSEAEEKWPCLQLKVCGYDDSNSMPVVYAMNGNKNGAGQNVECNSLRAYGETGWETVEAIPAGTKLLRIAKAVNEGASQTGRTAELPKTDLQFLQIFMTQTEESLIHKLTKRDVQGLDLAWHERRTLEDMRMVQEGTFLFSDMACINSHPKENLNKVWSTKGAWYMPESTVEFGTWDSANNVLEVEDDDLVNVNEKLFVGEGTGGKKKLWFSGSKVVTALEKIKSEKFKLKGDVQAWNLTFSSWKTTFGECLVIHDETFDKYGKSDCALSLDPEYFEKRVLLSLDRSVKDLDAMGVRATQAVVLKEISCIILYAPKAHARIKLASA